ncbi:MAG: hypothetical protein IPO69_02875 [Saprospiraceae bacterium]|nr:hypothetical protein [Saprospiraceae bacterium]
MKRPCPNTAGLSCRSQAEKGWLNIVRPGMGIADGSVSTAGIHFKTNIGLYTIPSDPGGVFDLRFCNRRECPVLEIIKIQAYCFQNVPEQSS